MKKKLVIDIPHNNNGNIKDLNLNNDYNSDINNRNIFINDLQNSGKSISPKKEEDNIWNMNKYIKNNLKNNSKRKISD